MVTAVANVLTEIGGVGARSANSGKGQGEGESAFAQLLEGMGGEVAPAASVAAPITDAVTPVSSDDAAADLVQNLMPMLSAEPILIQLPAPANKTLNASTADVSASTATAGLLAVSTANATQATAQRSTQGSTQIPALIATDAEAPVTMDKADAASTLPVVTTASTSTVQAAVIDPATTAPVDLQWLRAMTGAVRTRSDTAADTKLPVPRTGNATDTDLSAQLTVSKQPEPDHDLDSASSQSLIQMLAQTSVPMMMADLPRQDRAIISDLTPSKPDITVGLSAATAQPAGTALADASAALSSVSHHVRSPVGGHEWAAELGNKLTMMATSKTQSATLYMTPADLGPVQVRIDMNQDQASVWFTAEHAETRSALEQALPRLRELFTAQGMSLTDAGVFGNRSQQQQPQSGSQSGSQAQHAFASPLFGAEETNATAPVHSLSLSLLDAYA